MLAPGLPRVPVRPGDCCRYDSDLERGEGYCPFAFSGLHDLQSTPVSFIILIILDCTAAQAAQGDREALEVQDATARLY